MKSPSRPVVVAAVCAALLLATFAVFAGLRSHAFINVDDNLYVTANPHVQKGLSADSVAWAFTTNAASNWHPLTWLSHMLDVQLFGLDAGRHHLTSLLLHGVNAVLLFLLLFRMTGALWRSAFVAALFALHPLHVESVAWISERKDVLSTLLWLLTLGAWLAYLRTKKAAPYLLALALYALGLMAKPMLVTLPFTLLLLDFWPLKRLTLPLRGRIGEIKGLLWEKAPLFVLAAASCIVTLAAQGGAVQTLARFPLAERLANTPQAYGFYLVKTFWPSSLAIFYPHPHGDLVPWITNAALLGLACITVLAFRLRERAPYLAFGWLWYLGTLVPVIGLVQVGAQAMADRYTYMPLVGVFVALSWGLAEWGGRGKAARVVVPAAAAAALVALGFIARTQVAHWADSRTLMEHALAVTSGNALAHNNLGNVLARQGKIPEAVGHFEEALRIDPARPDTLNNLGNALSAQGRWPQAVERYREALRIQPRAGDPLMNLGMTYLQMGRIPEAVRYSARAVEADPDSGNARLCLARALDRAGRPSEALEQIRQALRITPDSVPALIGMGTVLGKMNRNAEAVEFLRRALKLAPESAEVHTALGRALDRSGLVREAEEQFRQALRIYPGDAEARAHLLSVQERVGRRPGPPENE